MPAPGAEPGPTVQPDRSVRLAESPRNVVRSAWTPNPAAVAETCVPWPELGLVDSESMGLSSGVGTCVAPGSVDAGSASYSGPAKSWPPRILVASYVPAGTGPVPSVPYAAA